MTKNPTITSVGPPVDFFLLLILWKPKHQIFIICWNFRWDLKSNLCPPLAQSGRKPLSTSSSAPFFRPTTAPLAAMFANAPSRYHGRRTRRSELQPVCPCNYGQLFFHCWTGANQRRKVGGRGATARHVVLRRRVAICLYLLLYLSLSLFH